MSWADDPRRTNVGTSLRILFVDDEESEVFFARRYLEQDRLEFTWRRVATESELREQIGAFEPDVVLCDYSIPGYSGIAALELARSMRPQTPVLIVSGTIPEDVAIRAMDRGACDYLLKSNLKRLGVAVRRAVAEARQKAHATELEREQTAFKSQIHQLTHYDTLTGLPNLSHMVNVVEQILGLSSARARLVALVTLSLDQFRWVEEGFGLAAANDMVKSMSLLLKARMRGDDHLARIGPDEFLIVLAELIDAAEAAVRVQQILQCIAEARQIDSQEVRITASAGIAMFPQDGGDFETLLRHSSAAMQIARSSRRGAFRFHSGDVTGRAQQQLRLETALRSAILNRELSLHYQPQFDIRTGNVCGLEALARWVPAQGMQIPPSIFIPLAEQMGLIDELGAWALEEACVAAGSWQCGSGSIPIMGVNVSTKQITSEFAVVLMRAIERGNLPAERVELEITESILLDDSGTALECLAQWKRLGVRIALDDFGAGYCNLSYLSRLPVDRLKVDASLIRTMTTEPKVVTVVSSVISLGRELGCEVLAEGVETAEQLQMLRELGCQQAQGFLLGYPVCASETATLVRAPW